MVPEAEEDISSIISIMRDIKDKIPIILEGLWWCNGGSNIVFPLVILRGTHEVKRVDVRLVDIPQMLDVNIEILRYGWTHVEPYIRTLITNNIIDLCSFVSMIEKTNKLMMEIRDLQETAKRVGASKKILGTLDNITGELKRIILDPREREPYMRSKELWEAKVDGIERMLAVLRENIKRKKIAPPPPEGIPVVPKEATILFGKEIGKTLLGLLMRSQRRIYIFTQAIHRVKIYLSKKYYRNLLKILFEKAREGVDVRIISKHPCNIPGIPLRYLSALVGLYNEHNIKHMFCWYMHMKVILVDDIVLVGSANFTSAGLDSFGEVALLICDERYVKLFEDTFNKIYNREHKMCMACPKRNMGVCGDARSMLLGILREELNRAIEKNNKKAEEIIERLIKEIYQ